MSVAAPSLKPKKSNENKPAQRPDGLPVLGDIRSFNQKGVDFWLESGRIAPVVNIRFGPIHSLLVTDAGLAKQILQTNNRNYIKERRLMKVLETGSEKVLFTTDGDEWMWRRRLMQPAFHRKQIARFCDTIVAESEAMVDSWQDGMTLDVDEAMKMVTMMIIGRTMFSVDMAGDSAELHHAYKVVGKYIIDRVTSLVQPPLWMPTKQNREFLAAGETINKAISTIIENRRHSTEPRGDLLDMLLAARLEDSDQSFTEDQVIYEMSQIVFAGHETTATTLTWLLYELARHPHVEAQLRAELERVLEGRAPAMEDLHNLTYMMQVLNETLRMYPAAYVASREAVEEDMLGDAAVSAEARIMINIIGIHHDPNHWPFPERFDPDRFEADRAKEHDKFAFMPFLNGPRKCIGEPLSRVEMQLILATVLQNYRFELPAGAQVEREAAFVLQPKGGLNMIAKAI